MVEDEPGLVDCDVSRAPEAETAVADKLDRAGHQHVSRIVAGKHHLESYITRDVGHGYTATGR